MQAGTAVEDALRKWLVDLGSPPLVAEAFESSPGRFRVQVVSDYFKDMSLFERQRVVWDLLRKTVDAQTLHLCAGIHVNDVDEYARTGGNGD